MNLLCTSRVCLSDGENVVNDSMDAAAALLSFHPLKPKQREAVEAFIRGKDVFVALPTGYGECETRTTRAENGLATRD